MTALHQCRTCSYRFETEHDHVTHVTEGCPEENESHFCTWCGAEFDTTDRLDEHADWCDMNEDNDEYEEE